MKRSPMKKTAITLFFPVLALAFALFMPGEGRATGALDLPPVKIIRLENGARIFYVQDELPQLTIVASVGFGRLYEKKATAGVADLLAKTISLGGSEQYPGMKLHEKIDSMGGTLSVSSSFETTVISIRVLPRFREEAFSILAGLLARPNLDESYFAMAKSLMADGIRRKYDDPFDVAFDRTMEIIFGGDSYGAIATEEAISSYTLEMMRDAWRGYFGAKNTLIAVSTSEPFGEINAASTKYFNAITPGKAMNYSVDTAALAEKIRQSGTKIFLYPKDLPQATIFVGTLGPVIKSPGYYSLTLMNFILGEGSFNSRLMREIRVKRGMAYSVSSILRMRRDAGVFLAFAQTKNENAATVLSLLRENVGIMAEEKIPGKDLEWAKRSLSNRFIFKFETPMDVLGNYLDREYYGLPERYYEEYLDRLNAVTGDEIVSESKKVFGGGLVTCVVGSENLKEILKGQGEVVLIK